jgi:demethylmenaquinone methyltransferase/2-methoxy-6-polyprenyl-1,4-benzoquinol methylase
MQKVAFGTITLIHDNPLLTFFKDPYEFLKAAGLQRGQKVLEVGCGPGFYTIPAAQIVGEKGLVYAVDVNPYAIARVRGKIAREGIKNVEPLLANASDTGLPERSIDLAFLVGLGHIAGGQKNVLAEIHRILRPGGVLSLQNTRGAKGKIIDEVEQLGFVFSKRKVKFFLFIKKR